mmetsp:Transcript_65453/g.140031  ORF Transcript_65453/g.140031 Transcript_65453/m.140031 type:complete len:247 (-) Transcript_65453:112-852(-)
MVRNPSQLLRTLTIVAELLEEAGHLHEASGHALQQDGVPEPGEFDGREAIWGGIPDAPHSLQEDLRIGVADRLPMVGVAAGTQRCPHCGCLIRGLHCLRHAVPLLGLCSIVQDAPDSEFPQLIHARNDLGRCLSSAKVVEKGAAQDSVRDGAAQKLRTPLVEEVAIPHNEANRTCPEYQPCAQELKGAFGLEGKLRILKIGHVHLQLRLPSICTDSGSSRRNGGASPVGAGQLGHAARCEIRDEKG